MRPPPEAHAAAKHPGTPLAGPYGHPFHPILVTVPIGAWVASVIFDLAGLFSAEGSAFAIGATWLIAVGLIGALAAAVFGFLDLAIIESGTVAKRIGLTHMTINLAVVVLFVISFAVRLGAGAGEPSVMGLVVSIIALAALGFSGWLGGKLAYQYGVRVAAESTQIEGFRAAK
ncbi:MAG TPA: DUF2231 domain-containing protein [Terrimesophilobacter sp.]|nr:DUF2231 domain-containing protein [Terrimesophilobacter sp.]HRP99533.1 DUF2231 domain-containing protein [Terrimesophilobacter sp.]